MGAKTTGIVEVASGGLLKSGIDAVIGRDPTAYGSVTLTGEGSRWIHAPLDGVLDSASIVVGQAGAGKLRVLAGALCQADTMYLGTTAGSVGEVIVEGDKAMLNLKILGIGLLNANPAPVGSSSFGAGNRRMQCSSSV
jgi:T5SS/PEP-CTERM-associated repeat protein